LGRGEEWVAEAQGHRSSDDGKREVEEIDDRRHRATNQGSGAFDDVRRRQRRRVTCDLGQCRAGGFRLEAASTTACTRATSWLYDHMPNVAGVAQTTAEEPTLEDDAAANAGRHDHGDEVTLPRRGASPALGQSQRFRIVFHECRDSCELSQPFPQGKPSPPTDIEG